jgi:hypothetical protein
LHLTLAINDCERRLAPDDLFPEQVKAEFRVRAAQ